MTRRPIPRNRAHPPTDRPTAGFGADRTSPEGRAAQVLLHPVRRWALEHAARTGQVTTLDLCRQFSYLSRDSASHLLKPALNVGVLYVLERRRGSAEPHVYRPGDRADLVALRDFLNRVLEEPRETE